jgi:branched-chain amino acid transport system substrate-binding protein
VVNNTYPELPLPLAATKGLADGSRLALVPVDTAGDANGMAAKAGQLVSQHKAVAMVVADSADVVAATTQQTEQMQIPLVDACSSADYLTELSRDWYFRLAPADRGLAGTALALLRQVQSALPATAPTTQRVVLLEGGSAANANTAESVRGVLDGSGYELVLRRVVGPGGPALPDLLADVAAAHPDVILGVVTTAQESVGLAEFTAQQGTVPVVALGHGVTGLPPSEPAGPGPGLLRVVGWSADLAKRNPVARAVGELYQRRFGTAITDVAASAFTATLTLAAGIDAAGSGAAAGPGGFAGPGGDAGPGSASPARVRAALRQLRLSATQMIMPWDGVRFAPNGQNSLAGGVVEQRIASGFQVVFPRELAAATVGWPGLGK